VWARAPRPRMVRPAANSVGTGVLARALPQVRQSHALSSFGRRGGRRTLRFVAEPVNPTTPDNSARYSTEDGRAGTNLHIQFSIFENAFRIVPSLISKKIAWSQGVASLTTRSRHAIYFSSFGVAAITTGSKLSTLLDPPNCSSISERDPSGLMW